MAAWALMAPAVTPAAMPASFGATVDGGLIRVDSGAGLVFSVKQSSGDIVSLHYRGGPELQYAVKGSHISSGLGAPTTVTVADGVVKITSRTPTLIQYLLVRAGDNTIYMATNISAEPKVGELRWITRLSASVLDQVPAASNLRGNSGTVESRDVFGLPNGETRSKYFGNQRAIDLTMRGVTGAGVGVYMVYGNRESSSGGPFYNDIQNQSGAATEVYNYMNSGHNQTEPFRTGLHGPYALVFTDGPPPPSPDMGWIGGQQLAGWVGADGRGAVTGAGLTGMWAAYPYTVAFANAAAQYWTRADAGSGRFSASGMKAGVYRMTVYKQEYAVATERVTVAAGRTTALPPRAIVADPSALPAVWRIGDWDGTPNEFIDSALLRSMHPSDIRHQPWLRPDFVVGTSLAARDFSPYQWRDVNGTVTIRFMLGAAELRPLTLRVGLTVAFKGARPQVQLNQWRSAAPPASEQPTSRSITLGSYRGNNAMFLYDIPAGALRVGQNVVQLTVVSGSAGSRYLSPGYAFDALDLVDTPAAPNRD